MPKLVLYIAMFKYNAIGTSENNRNESARLEHTTGRFHNRPGSTPRAKSPGALFLLVTVLSQTFFTLVRSHLVAFSFLTVGHCSIAFG